ncbi:MAG TPA: hypothetical protein VFG09_13415 [Thermodesulfovibrionales bacterium]|nr:hypothetical protein [Thermodesulfovibrionales bacterium]
MNPRDFAKKKKEYEMWVLRRINDKKALCRLYRGHRCIPSEDETCRSCFTLNANCADCRTGV